MKFKFIIYLATISIFLSCNQANKPVAASQDTTAKTSGVKIADDNIAKAYQHYISLKDALVKSDTIQAKNASGKLSLALRDVAGCENTSKIADSISTSGTLKEQRNHFVLLSAEVIPLIKHTSVSEGNIFIQHCPMANNGKGAFWLASEKEVKNPYYGDEMLECGEVTEEIKTK